MAGEPRVYVGALAVLVAVALPYVLPVSTVHMLILTFIIGVAAIAWNVIGGYGGQFSLGNGVFFGITGYTAGILLVHLEQSFLVSLTAGLAFSVLAAVIVGYPTFKLTGHYFALATITVVEGMRFLTRFFQDITGGAQGMSVIPAAHRGVVPLNLARPVYYTLALALFVLAFLVSAWIRYHRLGYYLMALRDDQLAAASVGIDVSRYKMYGWIVSAVLTGAAGMMYMTYIQFLDPDYMFSITQSVLFAVIPIIGGIGTVIGPVLGTFLMVPLQHFAVTELGGRFGAITYVGFGTVLILLIMFAPEGFAPRLASVGRRIEEALPTFGDDADPPWRR